MRANISAKIGPHDQLAPSILASCSTSVDWTVAGYLARIRPAYAARTIDGLRSDWRLFSGWCRARDLCALPAHPETLARYLAELSYDRSYATVRRHLATIAHLHRAAGLPAPADATEVRLTCRAIARAKGLYPDNGRAPLREAAVEQVLKCLGPRLRDRRDRALLLVARDTLGRRSDLARLRFEDVAWPKLEGAARLLIRRSKNDPFGQGRSCWLSPQAVDALTDWRDRTGLTEGSIFRRVIGVRRIGAPLGAQAVAERIKAMAARAGLDAAAISGHSPRIGMCLDLVADGQSLVAIQLAGGWLSARMPAHYARQLLPELGAVARYHRAQAGP